MDKPVIGIVCARHPVGVSFENYSKFVNTYPKRIIEAGGIPIGLLFPLGKFNPESASLCDGFLFQGGPLIEGCQMAAVHYAVSHNKLILGICLGAQTMAGYEWISNELGDMLTYDSIESFFKPENEGFFLDDKPGHDNVEPFSMSRIEEAKHGVLLDPDSKVCEAFGDSYVLVPSIHKSVIAEHVLASNKFFKVSGRSSDGDIEAIEGVGDVWQVGVQFHPELEDQNKVLFKKFVSECKKNR